MTKEQEEAIEMLEDIKNNSWTTKYIMSSDSAKAETVLNMLKEKDREIQELKQALARNIAKNFTSSVKESAKSKEDLEMLNKGWQIELEKKDKIIYEMIGSFIDMGFGFEYCNNDNRCINNCEKCIKQYFEKLAERKSEEC